PHSGVVDLAGKFVPAVPSHGRRAHETVVTHVVKLRQRQTLGRQGRFGLGAFGSSLHWLSSCDLRRHLDLVVLESALVNGLAYLAAAAGPGDEVQLAIFKRAVSDGKLSCAGQNLAGDVLAVLLEVNEGLAKIAVAGGHAKNPEAGEIGLRQCRDWREQAEKEDEQCDSLTKDEIRARSTGERL